MTGAGFLPQETIRRKRDGGRLEAAEIEAFIAGLTSGAITEGQAAAFAMAVFFRGLEREESVALTLAMRDSGQVLDWSGLDRPVLDKHSTGGVGDKVSLPLAGILAACGAAVPMISGRGLGHTGGTLDKLDSIPGYATQPDVAAFRRAVAEAGCAIIGQTADLAPADRRLYEILRLRMEDLLPHEESDDLVGKVREEVARLLSEGAPLAEVAKRLGVGARTLQRRLRDRGLGFNGIVDDVRRERSFLYLQREDLTVSEIAFRLGYSEASAFDRAFRRWSGTSPLQFRRGVDGWPH